MQNFPKLSKAQQEVDSIVMGAILAGMNTSKKKLSPGSSVTESAHSICAIGAGNRGKNVTRPSDVIILKTWKSSHHQLVPLVRFAMANNVSENYACGVNDGFENGFAAKAFYPEVDITAEDYLRGFSVGSAVRLEAGY